VQPETKYARLGGDRIAYQVLGQGPPDLVLAPGSFSHVDIGWEDPGVVLFCRTLASFSRLILFDRRGTGASDPLAPDSLPPWESYAEELAVILDEVDSQRAAILAEGDAGPTALFFAGTRPERTSALILVHTMAKFVASDDYPIGMPTEVAEALVAQFEELWGTEAMAAMLVPSRAGDERFRRWLAKLVRTGGSPRAAQAFLRAVLEVDVRPVLPLIQAPTLVLHRRDYQFLSIEHGRFLAEHLPEAKLVELPGADGTLVWETPELALDLIEEFLTGVRRPVEPPASWPRCCLPTSSAPPNGPAGSETGAGGSYWTSTTSWPADSSRSFTGGWSTRPVMASWPPSTAPAGPSDARPISETSCAASDCKSGQACTPARSSSATVMLAVSPCTLRPGSWPRLDPVRSSPPGPYGT
jgi:pimeloyl-ACP methyl ester carboxylesterase